MTQMNLSTYHDPINPELRCYVYYDDRTPDRPPFVVEFDDTEAGERIETRFYPTWTAAEDFARHVTNNTHRKHTP